MIASWRTLGTVALAAVAAGAPPRAQEVVPARVRDAVAPDDEPAVETIRDVPVRYSDGYRSLGDLHHPLGAPPRSGWPLVVLVHGLGGGRNGEYWQVSQRPQRLASRGFAVWAVDVRGQGDAARLQPDGPYGLEGGNEKLDLVEQIAFARRRFDGLVRTDRVAVAGTSQGAIFAWWAASASGREIVVPGRPARRMPRIDCAVASCFVPNGNDHRVRDGRLFAAGFVRLLAWDRWTDASPSVWDEELRGDLLAAFLRQDPAAAVAGLDADPLRRASSSAFATCRTPLLFFGSYHDTICGLGPAVDALRAIPTSTPWRCRISTNQHGSPLNVSEFLAREALEQRWLERFLGDVENGVDREPRVELAAVPGDPSACRDVESTWPTWSFTDWDACQAGTARRFLSPGGRLVERFDDESRPTVPLRHRVRSGYDADALLGDLAAPDRVLEAMPLHRETFELDCPRELRLAGLAHVRLRVVGATAAAQLVAELRVEGPRSGDRRLVLATWGSAVAAGDGRRIVDLPLGPVATVVPAGSKVVLELRSQWLVEPPPIDRPYYAVVPELKSFDVEVECGPETWIELPLCGPTPALAPKPIWIWRRDRSLTVRIHAGTTFARRRGVVAVEPLVRPGAEPAKRTVPFELDANGTVVVALPAASLGTEHAASVRLTPVIDDVVGHALTVPVSERRSSGR